MKLGIICGLIGVVFSLLGYPVFNIETTQIEYKNTIALILTILIVNILHRD
jgi:hypothetical protein